MALRTRTYWTLTTDLHVGFAVRVDGADQRVLNVVEQQPGSYLVTTTLRAYRGILPGQLWAVRSDT